MGGAESKVELVGAASWIWQERKTRRIWIGEDPEVGDECGGGSRDKSPRI